MRVEPVNRFQQLVARHSGEPLGGQDERDLLLRRCQVLQAFQCHGR